MDQRGDELALGIDPGTTRIGYALVKGTSVNFRLLESGVIGNQQLPPHERILWTHRQISAIIRRAKPSYVALEKIFFSKNAKTALAVAESRGAILLTAKIANLTVYEYAPQEIKIAAASKGNATKNEVARMVQILFKLQRLPRWDDETDAIAIALTGIVTQGMRAKVEKEVRNCRLNISQPKAAPN